jgi:hypothetical protein
MRLLLLGALMLGTGAGSASAALNDGYRSQTATTARLTAKLTYKERVEGYLHHYSDASVAITRSDGSTFTYALVSRSGPAWISGLRWGSTPLRDFGLHRR